VHIPEGILSVPVFVAGAALSVGGVAIGLRKMDYDRVPQVAVLSSAFFVVSLIHVSSVHLTLNGLAGLLLGWAVFPALLVALFLQAVLFQHGGLTVLGVNTFIMAFPGVVVHYLLRATVLSRHARGAAVGGFLAGALAVVCSLALLAASLIATGRPLVEIAKLVSVFHIPIVLVEGFITGAMVGFLRRVRPELLRAPVLEGKRRAET